MTFNIEIADNDLDKYIDNAAERKALKYVPYIMAQIRQELGLPEPKEAIADPEIAAIALMYCAEYKISISAIMGKSRRQSITEHRFVLCYILHKKRYEYKRIGRYLSRRDHSTIINAVQNVSQFIEIYADWAKRIRTAENLFKD